MKYIKLFENFKSSIFNSAAIESLNKKLYDEIGEGSAYMDSIIEDWTKQIYDMIKSVAPFKDKEVKMTQGMGMVVGWGHAPGLFAMHLPSPNDHGDLHRARA